MYDFEQPGVSHFDRPSNPANRNVGHLLYDIKDVVVYAI